MVADKGKKAKVAPVEETEPVDDELVLSIEKLQEAQDELEKVNEEASDKMLEVEQKYNEIRRPMYLKRNDVIKTIPDFWLTAFLSHPVLCDILSEEDQKIFKHLDSLDVEDFKDLKSGYSITFNFTENPYFEDTKLTKSFSFSDEGTTQITGTLIKWKEGMAALVNGVNDEKKGKKRSITHQSFFSWFCDTEQTEIIELQDEVGEIIKEDLWPNPLKYFNSEADEEDSDDDENENDEEENGDDEKGEETDDEE
ncbi:NAP1-related protein 2-like isoform X2 [Humulus lupulus]|uniref:NAP1-related protein 2-like isoform X2 n=1 Tax=Humulus lupulus TaxID=3486 RepID=UPI002B416EFF|nr:NAP1-related protein 2-like isoform X2 [Humulus lupulus]